jgi:hypothetical protein
MKEEKDSSHPKRSIELRLPSSSFVQVGGKQERFALRVWDSKE